MLLILNKYLFVDDSHQGGFFTVGTITGEVLAKS